MKNITTIERTAMEKTAIEKTAMQKIKTTALLFFLALFTLTTNLKAQAVQDNSKSGFFAGFVYLQGFQVDSTKSVSTSPTTSYRVTGYSPETTRIDATGGIGIRNDIGQIRDLFSANCERDATSSGSFSFHSAGIFASFSPGKKPTAEQIADEDATVTLSDTDGNLFRTGVGDTYTSHCYRYFYGDLSSARTSFVYSRFSRRLGLLLFYYHSRLQYTPYPPSRWELLSRLLPLLLNHPLQSVCH